MAPGKERNSQRRIVVISHQSIGFFDSGWGGLSILKTARKVLPHENFIYVADCGFAPYGDRSHDFIVERARKIASFLLETKQVKALVIACNTATAEAIDSLRQQWPQAIIIGVEPAVKAAVTLSKNKRIGMISTTRTAQSERYHRLLERFGHNATIISQGCPGLMECVEAGEFTDIRQAASPVGTTVVVENLFSQVSSVGSPESISV